MDIFMNISVKRVAVPSKGEDKEKNLRSYRLTCLLPIVRKLFEKLIKS